MSALLEQLREALGADAVLTEDWALQSYGVDRTRVWSPAPLAVLRPDSIEAVQACVRLARQHGHALVPSGGRTGLSGGAVATQGELVLSLDRMNKLLDFNPVDQCVTLQAGVITAQLQAFAREQGLCYPVDFASAGSSQMGGNIATNAGGIKVIRYGMTRDWVRGLKVVTGRGELLDLNQGLIKNNTGLDFRHLMIGSEGTLAVICEATMALAAAPADPLLLLLGVPRFSALMPLLGAFKSALQLNAFECFSDAGLQKVLAAQSRQAPLSQPAPFYALIELDDDPSVLEKAMAIFEEGLDQQWITDGVVSQSLSQAKELWLLRESLSDTLAAWTPYKNDISVRVSRLPAFVDEVEQLVCARYQGFEVVWYGHIGDGNLHLNILKPEHCDQEAFLQRCATVTEDISALVQAHGGSISAEHGLGLLKRDYLHYTRSAQDIALMQQVKQVFDPDGILNPGKMLARPA